MRQGQEQVAEKQKEIDAMVQLVMDRDESNKNLRSKVDVLTKHIQVQCLSVVLLTLVSLRS